MARRASSVIPLHRRLEYSAGFLALGLLKEAAEELRAIPRSERGRPEVLSAFSELHMHTRDWMSVVKVCSRLAQTTPEDANAWISWAYALREMERTAEAQEVLWAAEPRHGATCAVLHYNLACYACLLGNEAEATRRLGIAIGMDKEWREAALTDSDLRAMWSKVPRIRATPRASGPAVG